MIKRNKRNFLLTAPQTIFKDKKAISQPYTTAPKRKGGKKGDRTFEIRFLFFFNSLNRHFYFKNEKKKDLYCFNSAEMNPINGVKPMEDVKGAWAIVFDFLKKKEMMYNLCAISCSQMYITFIHL